MKKLILMSVLIALGGCATPWALKHDAQNAAMYQATMQKAGFINADANLDLQIGATVRIESVDSGGKPIVVTAPGHYTPLPMPNIQAPKSAVEAETRAQAAIAPAVISAGVSIYNGYEGRKLERHRIGANQFTALQQIEANKQIEIDRNDLIKNLVDSKMNPIKPDGGAFVPCPIRADAGEFVAGSPTDGWAESAGFGECVEITAVAE